MLTSNKVRILKIISYVHFMRDCKQLYGYILSQVNSTQREINGE